MIDLKEYGYTPYFETQEQQEFGVIPARITAVYKELYKIISCYGEGNAKLKSSVYYINNADAIYPTTGDFVLIKYNEIGDSIIIKTLPRKSCFTRKDPDVGRGEQVIAANFDYVFIMASLNYDFNLKRIERYLTASWQSGAVPVILLTKADLVDDYSDTLRSVKKIAIGVNTYAISAYTKYGLDNLSDYLQPQKTIVFLGSSGVGKSSLVNELAQEHIMDVNGIREDDSKGHHTTTRRQLIKLKNGVMIIDTPGMRELGMWDISDGLSEAFTDVENLIVQCKFSDCMHQNEPGCAVRLAIENGQLELNRWNSYMQLAREAKYSDDKLGYLRQKQQWHKTISKYSKQIKRK